MALGSNNHPYQRHQQLLSVARGIYQQHQRAIAPAPHTRAHIAPYATKANATGTTLDSNNPSIIRRNARERNRVKQVNNGFSNLRQHLPPAIVADLSNGRRGIGPGAHKKLSKVDTLRMALEYIRRLQRVIEEVDSSRSATQSCGAATQASAMQQQFSAVSYAGSFGQQQQQQSQQQQLLAQSHTALNSPAASTVSCTSEYSSDSSSFYRSPTHAENVADYLPLQLKFASSFDAHAQHCREEDDILDYISLWQEEM